MAMVITQKFWECGDPLSPLLGKIPKKYRFFWKCPLRSFGNNLFEQNLVHCVTEKMGLG